MPAPTVLPIPMQVSAKDMDPAMLKARFGDRMAFWGGAIDTQHVLPSAPPETIREHVRRNLELWKPGGGYVFNNVHNIQAGVPPEIPSRGSDQACRSCA